MLFYVRIPCLGWYLRDVMGRSLRGPTWNQLVGGETDAAFGDEFDPQRLHREL